MPMSKHTDHAVWCKNENLSILRNPVILVQNIILVVHTKGTEIPDLNMIHVWSVTTERQVAILTRQVHDNTMTHLVALHIVS